jgi:hypothetical protein
MMATLVARNANKAMVGYGRVCIWQESGVRELVLCWCIWQKSGFSCHDEVFTINLLYKEICMFCKFCTFHAICEDNAAIKFTTFHKQKKVHSHQL